MSQFIPIGGNNQQDVFRKPNNPYFTPQEFWKEKGLSDFYDAGARVDNGSSALHAITLHYWSRVFGISDAALRSLSVLFGVLLVFSLYWFVLFYFESEGLALAVAALATVEPLFVNWSQTVRTYTMTYFFGLLATHLFFKILKLESSTQRRPVGLYVVYGICVFACLMCHLSMFQLFLAHGFIVLLFVRQWRAWIGLALAMVVPVAGLLWWRYFGGGQYTFKFIADSAYAYNMMAKNNPILGYLAPTTPYSVWVQIWPILTNHYLPTNGLFDALLGKKNLALALFTVVGSVGMYGWVKNERLKQGGIFALFGVALLLYSESKIRFTVLSVGLILLIMLIKSTFEQRGAMRQKYFSMWILTLLPLLFLVVFAVQDANTFRMQHKYAGCGMAFSLTLVVLGLKNLWTAYPTWVKYPMALVLVVQLGFVGQTLWQTWHDRAPRYAITGAPRVKNPHANVAKLIVEKYALGDTVVYPSYLGADHEFDVETAEYSIHDAQLVNFYLPKNARYWQRIDRREPNKVYLKKANGGQELLFDFRGAKYRY